tara:strand:+ start:65629 stop:66486 length:858 start_codon:yes stop_codon:yes gene_type:complete
LHPKNLHHSPYNFKELVKTHATLVDFVSINEYGIETIDFANPLAVLHLNTALLKHYYKINDWHIPDGYLCPPIPGRADYLHYIFDLLEIKNEHQQVKGLDIGVGANCIYPILGSQLFNWKMVGADIDTTAINSAKNNIGATKSLKENIEIRHQQSNADLFKGIIKEGEYFDFTMCNPPFHASEKEANSGTLRKLKNIKNEDVFKLNFGGQANELWCNGGEALFIKRMIKQSVGFKIQVGWFTCLVSKNEHLNAIYKLLKKAGATYKTITMEQGNKKSRFVAWKFL